MQGICGSHIHCICQLGSIIFGNCFEQQWFLSEYDRSTLPEFQKLLGAMATSGGKKYPLLPPVLYLHGLMSKDTLFLNPTLAKVCVFACSRNS